MKYFKINAKVEDIKSSGKERRTAVILRELTDYHGSELPTEPVAIYIFDLVTAKRVEGFLKRYEQYEEVLSVGKSLVGAVASTIRNKLEGLVFE